MNGSKVPEDNKVSRLEKNEVKKKPLTKVELQNNYDILIKEHKELVKLHQENLVRIDKLENTIFKIRKEKVDSIEKIHVEAQTDDSVTCNECEFPANDIWELGEHIYEFHTLKDHGDFACKFCYDKFGRKRDLMVHRKNYHEDKLGVCIAYRSGNCTYTRDECWWKHEKTPKMMNISVLIVMRSL